MKRILIAILFVGCCPLYTSSFTLLVHEAMVDASWGKYIKPLLRYRFSEATEEELEKARVFVYGGAILPDVGYYPFGSSEFSNLVHYIRSGDFVIALLQESKDIQEYAFALGVLCHYEADNFGHPLGTNKAMGILFSKSTNKVDGEMTFEQDQGRHIRVELGFDVLQTARGNYKPNAYHDFIGFQINEPVLKRAFLKTYGVNLKDVFKNFPAAISNLRYAFKVILPELTKNAWKLKNSTIKKSNPLATKNNYHYQMSGADYRREFPRPKVQAIFIAIIIGVLPKYKPRLLPSAELKNREVEELFRKSFNAALTHCSTTLNKLYSVDCNNKNINLDTGTETMRGEYALADKTYFDLLMRLEKNEFAYTSRMLKKNLVDYYSNRNTAEAKVEPRKDKMVANAMTQLNSMASIRRANE